MIVILGSNTLIQEGGETMDQNPRMRRMHPCLFQGVCIHKKETDLCSTGRDTSVHSFIQSTSDFDVSLHGGIPLGRPPDWKMNKVFCNIPKMNFSANHAWKTHYSSMMALDTIKYV